MTAREMKNIGPQWAENIRILGTTWPFGQRIWYELRQRNEADKAQRTKKVGAMAQHLSDYQAQVDQSSRRKLLAPTRAVSKASRTGGIQSLRMVSEARSYSIYPETTFHKADGSEWVNKAGQRSVVCQHKDTAMDVNNLCPIEVVEVVAQKKLTCLHASCLHVIPRDDNASPLHFCHCFHSATASTLLPSNPRHLSTHHEWFQGYYEGWLASEKQKWRQGELAQRLQRHQPSGLFFSIRSKGIADRLQAGWMGKGKDPNANDRSDHVSKPLSSLKDPASFGPPPKHINYHGPAALPSETTPDRRGLGAPLSQDQIEHQQAQQQQQREEEEVQEEKPARPTPPVPYRVDRTGLSTNHLPPPPKRMDLPASAGTTDTSRPKPSLPPRVPSRDLPPASQSPSRPPAYSPQPASGYSSEGYINQQAASNLSNAGVSVPEFGIGNDTPANSTGQAPVNELQSRFSRMNTGSSPTPPPPPPSRTQRDTQGSSTSPSTSSSISNLRERHGDKIDAGKQKISGINEKYGISRRVNNFIEDQKSPAGQGPPPPAHPSMSRTSSNVNSETLNRKAPPPPPPKKPGMRASPVSTGSAEPPPLPLDTKPR